MAEITLESLGIEASEVRDRIIERCCERVLYDSDGELSFGIEDKLRSEIASRIDESITDLGERHVLPGIKQYLEELKFVETNRYGEKKGEDQTLLEYLTARADAFITEPVDLRGKARAEESYGWKANQSRISHMVHEHLQYSIKTAVAKALKDFNAKVANGLAETVKIQLADVLKRLKVDVKA